jgi:predicted MFS family arabinose efflux permease
MGRPPWRVVWALSATQIVAWGSQFYAITLLAEPIAQATGWSREAVVGAYSLSLLVAGLASFPTGLALDRFGGRAVMTAGSVISALAFALIARVETLTEFYAGWALIGLAGAMTQYEAAFATIAAAFGAQARRGITVVTFAGGLASTVFWPVTAVLLSVFDWRRTCDALALFNLLLCVPLHALFLGDARPAKRAAGASAPRAKLSSVLGSAAFWWLAIAFTAHYFFGAAMAVHVVAILAAQGLGLATAVAVASLIGVMQVAGRVFEFVFGRNFSIQSVGLAAAAILPLALLMLASGSPILLLAFVVPYGACNGIFTIVRGEIPRVLFGGERYGAVSGALSAPALLARAAAPLIAASLIEGTGGYGAVLAMLIAAAVLSALAFWLAVRGKPAG